MNRKNDAMTAAYEHFCAELSKSLYDEDPAGIGSSIDAPLDEYDAIAARLAVLLKDASDRDKIAHELNALFGISSDELINRVLGSVREFRESLTMKR